MKIPRAKLYIDFFILLKSFFKILLGIDFKRGVKVENFEKTVSNYWNRKKCLTVSTCRVSLHYVLKSLQLNPDDQVLLTPIQIPDFINVIIDLKLKPIFLEIDKKTKSVDLDDLEKKINNRSKVLLATYLNGMVPNIEKISDICSKNSIHLIEDISHSYGSFCGQKKAGTFGLTAISKT